MHAARVFLRSFLLITAAALAACAQQGGAGVPATPLALRGNIFTATTATPPPCTGQKDSKDYASVATTLSTKGGTFCVPAFGGFGGTIAYPKVKPSVKVTIISSSTDYNKLPQLGSGTAIFYLQMTLAHGTTFGHTINPTGGLTGALIKSGQSYSAYGEATISGQTIKFGPCYETATKGTYGGVLASIGGLLDYASLPAKTDGFIELYSGKDTKTPC
jgi:hypothetical protein